MTVACRKPRRTISTASTAPRMPVRACSPLIDASMASDTCSDAAMPGDVCRRELSAGELGQQQSTEEIKQLRADRPALSPLKFYDRANNLDAFWTQEPRFLFCTSEYSSR